MKKLLAILLAGMLLLTACTPAQDPDLPGSSSTPESSDSAPEKPDEPTPALPENVPVNQFEVSWNGVDYPKGGFVYESAPQLYGDTILFIENQQDGRGEGKNGNVYTFDILTKEVTPYNIYAHGAVHLYGGNIYYRNGETPSVYNIKTGETKPLETGITKKGTLLDYSSFWNEYAILCDWNSGGEGIHTVYSHNLETGKTVCLAKNIVKRLNEFTGRDFKIKNGYAAYAEYTSEGFEIHAANIATGENTVIKTLEEELHQSDVIYNGKYLLWCDDEGVKVCEDGKERLISQTNYGVELLQDKLAVCATKNYGFEIYDLEGQKKIFFSSENYSDILFETLNMSFTSDSNLLLAVQHNNMYLDEHFTKTLYPDWNWESQGQYADAPYGLCVLEIYQYPNKNTPINEIFTFAEGVEAIKLTTFDYYTASPIETETALIYEDDKEVKVFDKTTGKLLEEVLFTGREYNSTRILRIEKCPEVPEYDYRILTSNAVIYKSVADREKIKSIAIPKAMKKDYGIYESRMYAVYGDTYAYYSDKGIVLEKMGSEPQVILEHGYYKSVKDFGKQAKAGPKADAFEWEGYALPTYFVDPYFVCDGTKLVAAVASQIQDGSYNGFVVYDIASGKIVDSCWQGTMGYSLDFAGENKICCAGSKIYNIETGELEVLPEEAGFDRHFAEGIMIVGNQKAGFKGGPNFAITADIYDLKTGEKRPLIMAAKGAENMGIGYITGMTENYVLLRIDRAMKEHELYAVKFR